MSIKAWEDGPSYIDMPRSMNSYVAPAMPDAETMQRLDGARETLRWLQAALTETRDATQPVLADLSGLDADSREVIHQVLGEGVHQHIEAYVPGLAVMDRAVIDPEDLGCALHGTA